MMTRDKSKMNMNEAVRRAITALSLKTGAVHESRNTFKLAMELDITPKPRGLFDESLKIERGKYRVPTSAEIDALFPPEGKPSSRRPVKKTPKLTTPPAVQPVVAAASNVVEFKRAKGSVVSNRFDLTAPAVDPNYVRFGSFTMLKQIFSANRWFTMMITGDSGFGKTQLIMQAAAAAKREIARVNFTPMTDESELIGERGLEDSSTFFEEGVVIAAMKRGAILLLDELDYASPMGFSPLQSIMEGSPYLVKKTGELVYPAPGFCIVATMNTKGRGDTAGRFNGTGLINVAFLERFVMCLDHGAPTPVLETKILKGVASSFGIEESPEFVSWLELIVRWANEVRKTVESGAAEETISTRRLIHIVNAYSVVGHYRKAVELAIARHDQVTRESFIALYDQLDPNRQKIEPTTPAGDF